MKIFRSRIFKLVSVLSLFILVAFFSNAALAWTAPDILWENIFGGDYSDSASEVLVVKDANGNEDGFLVVGTKKVYVGPGYRSDILLARTDNDGNFIAGWGDGDGTSTLVFNGGIIYVVESQQVFDAQGNPDGYIMGGYDSSQSGLQLIKVDNNGALQSGWGTNADGTSYFGDAPYSTYYNYSVKQVFDAQGNPDGYVSLGGLNHATLSGISVIRTDVNGVALIGWGNNGNGSTYIARPREMNIYDAASLLDKVYDAQGNPDGFIVIGTGSYHDTIAWVRETHIGKLDNNGAIEWHDYVAPSYQWRWTKAVKQTASGGYQLIGRTKTPDYSEDALFVTNTDDQGQVLSTTLTTFTLSDVSVFDTIFTSDGGYAVTGEAETGPETDHWGVFLAKVDSGGTVLWETVTPGSYNCDWADDVKETADGGFIVVGEKGLDVGAPNYYDIYMLRYASPCDQAGATGSVSPSQDILWPPNHDVVPITIDASQIVTNNPDTYIRITSVAISEYSGVEAGEVYGESTYDENNFEPDVEITGDLSVNLRAERAGASTGRTYTVTVTATDCAGDHTFTTEVNVPHDKR